MTGYDYIIVGAGTAGCVLAARLTQDPGIRVLLLEAGDHVQTPALTVPAAWPGLIGGPADWGSFTIAQADAGVMPYPRGRVLGGSGEINAMTHLRGHRAVYDAWAAAGAAGWAYADLLPYFQRSEHAVGGDPRLRGTAGPVRVAPVPESARHLAAAAFAGALRAMGFPEAGDLSAVEGVGWPDLAIDGGQRVSPAGAYLRPVLCRPNLTVQAGSLAARLLVRRGRCTGVSYLRRGVPAQAQTSGEVIVCAGAVGSPLLLMLSGIGPAGQLRDLGIDPVADLPGTGTNLQDHPVAMVCCTAAAALPASRYNHLEACAVLRTALAGGWPDLRLFPVLFPAGPAGYRGPDGGFALAAAVVAPDSRGTVRLAADDPLAAPLIDPGLLRDGDGRDLDRLEAGLGILRQAVSGAVFKELGITETWPGPVVRTGSTLRSYIRRTAGSCHHPAGTCRIGPETDPGAVTDPQLRVRGIGGLRVADASVIPLIPNAPPNATVLAIAEKAADLITRSRPPGHAPSASLGSRKAPA